jgi:hypothetical protein
MLIDLFDNEGDVKFKLYSVLTLLIFLSSSSSCGVILAARAISCSSLKLTMSSKVRFR